MARDHSYLDTNSNHLFCSHCGAATPLQLPVPIDTMVSAMTAFDTEHRSCPKPQVLFAPPRPNRPLPLHEAAFIAWPGLADWLRHGEVGLSSLTLAAAITNLPLADLPYAPMDAADFGRCVGLLRAVPSMRARLVGARDHLPPEWSGLVSEWMELEALADAGETKSRALTERVRSLTSA